MPEYGKSGGIDSLLKSTRSKNIPQSFLLARRATLYNIHIHDCEKVATLEYVWNGCDSEVNPLRFLVNPYESHGFRYRLKSLSRSFLIIYGSYTH